MSTLIDMVRRLVGLIALGLALAMGSVPVARAQDGSPDLISDVLGEAKEIAVLTVPFNPPLGKPLAYTVVIEKKRDKGDSRMELEQALTFEALGDGYLLDLDMLAVIFDGERFDLSDSVFFDALPAAVRPFLMSVEIELDPTGEPLRMRDWEAQRQLLQSLPQTALEGIDPDEREGALPALRMLFDPLISSKAEEAAYAIVKGWPSILGYDGLELEEAELYVSETEIESSLLPTPISADVELSLSATDDGDYHFFCKLHGLTRRLCSRPQPLWFAGLRR